MHMVAPSVKQAVYLSKQGIPVYQYHFSKKPSWHSIELNYIFGSPFTSKNKKIALIEFNYNGIPNNNIQISAHVKGQIQISAHVKGQIGDI